MTFEEFEKLESQRLDWLTQERRTRAALNDATEDERRSVLHGELLAIRDHVVRVTKLRDREHDAA